MQWCLESEIFSHCRCGDCTFPCSFLFIFSDTLFALCSVFGLPFFSRPSRPKPTFIYFSRIDMLKLFVFLALICSSIASASHTHSSRSLSFSSPLIQRQPRSSAHKHIIGRGLLKQRRPVPESWTNAKRLTAGLPLKPPVRRGNGEPVCLL